MTYRPLASFHDWNPVSIGLVPAIAAPVNAARATGGVTLESWLNQKTIRCAESRAKVRVCSLKTASRTMPAMSIGTASTIIRAVAVVIGLPISARCSGAASMKIALAASGICPLASTSTRMPSAIRPCNAGADRVPSTI